MNRPSLRLAATLYVISAFMTVRGEVSAKQIYWTDYDFGMKRANLDGTSITPVLQGPVGRFEVSDESNAIFYSGDGLRKFTPQNGVDSFLFDTPGYSNFSSIAVDRLHSHLYFVDSTASAIYRTDLDGSNPVAVIPGDGLDTNLTRIEHVEVDPIAGKIYWTYLSTTTTPWPYTKSFRRSNLDGSQQEQLFTVQDFIMDFELEPSSGQIYWTSSGYWPNTGAVRRANYDGSNAQTLVSGNLWGLYGLALDVEQGKLYFSDAWTSGPTAYDNTLRVANLDGSDAKVLINFGPKGAAYHLSIGDVVPEPASVGLATVAIFALGACQRLLGAPWRN